MVFSKTFRSLNRTSCTRCLDDPLLTASSLTSHVVERGLTAAVRLQRLGMTFNVREPLHKDMPTFHLCTILLFVCLFENI